MERKEGTLPYENHIQESMEKSKTCGGFCNSSRTEMKSPENSKACGCGCEHSEKSKSVEKKYSVWEWNSMLGLKEGVVHGSVVDNA